MADSATLALHRYALDWQPNNNNDRNFYLVAGLCLGASLLLSMVVANTVVPPAPVQTQAPVAPRIVNFMANRPKPVLDIPPPKPLPKPIVAPPKIKTRPVEPAQPVTPTPTVVAPPEPAATSLGRTRPSATTTDPNKASARAKAQSAGLLALGTQVASVLDTAPSTQALAQTASTQTAQAAATTNVTDHMGTNRQLSLKSTAVAGTSTRALDQQAVQASAQDVKRALNTAAAATASSGTGRSDKDIAGVFAQNQPSLNSLFERARRQIPGLAGKLVLELNIAADGSVTSIKVLASELNNAELEGKIIGRVKLFKFAAGKAQAGVKYAMEFVPG
jgi:periplasmic protein TonB